MSTVQSGSGSQFNSKTLFQGIQNNNQNKPRLDTSDTPAEELSQIFSDVKKFSSFAIGAMLAKNLLYTVGRKFLETDSLPVKVEYIDWWPLTRQKVKEFASKFWERRIEGATASALSSSAVGAAWWFSEQHPLAGSFWNLAKKTTLSCLDRLGFQDAVNFPDGVVTLTAFPAIVGLGTSLALGTYDSVRKYFDRDRVLQTKPIFNPTLQADLDDILATACTLKEEKGFLQNLLFYGPPGTGKTMASKWIASHSKMNYIFMSGGDLLKSMNNNSRQGGNQTGSGAAVAMLQKLIDHAKNLSSPTVVFIDEAEACFGKRDTAKSQELISLLNAFLELTGQPTSKMMLILATNRPNDVDQAVLSRMDYKIYVGPPEFAERKQMIQKNIQILVNTAEERQVFTEANIDHIAKQTEGFSGRDLFKLINRLKIVARQQKALDPTNIDQVLAKFVRQEQQVEIQLNLENPLKNNPFYSVSLKDKK